MQILARFVEYKVYWNYFYHIWQTLSCSTLENAVVFSTADAPTPQPPTAAVSPKTASVKAGETQQFTASTDPASATDITWEVAGNTKAGTTISASGLLTVDATEEPGADKLTITFKGKVNGTDVTDTAKVTVTA